MYLEIQRGDKLFIALKDEDIVFVIDHSSDNPRFTITTDEDDDLGRGGAIYEKTINRR